MSKKVIAKKTAGQKVSTSKRGGKIWILALDPFSDLNNEPLIEFGKAAAASSGGRVIGAYVLSPESLNWTGEFSGPWITKYRPVAEGKAREIADRHGIEFEVIPCRSTGLSASVSTLAKFAKKTGAESIIVATHGRSGLERMILGSFAESLILSSSIPVTVMHPDQPVRQALKKIVVPVDLGPATMKFVDRVGAFSKRVGASVEIFYKMPDPLDPIIQQGVYAVGGGWVSVQSYFDEDTKNKEAELKTMVKKLQAKGINANWTMDTSSPALVPAVVAFAKKSNADVIAVLTQSGKMTAVILGSVARQLVRTATVPIMIWR